MSINLRSKLPKFLKELVIKSAKDIKGVSIRNEMNVYASVLIRECKTTIKDTANTPIAYCAYRNPRWDHEVEFSLDQKLVQEGRLTLVVKIIGVRPLLGDKNVGEVVISIQELFELNPPSLPKGTLTFTYRFLVEQAPQPFIMYPVHGTSGCAIVHPGANAGPSNGQLPLYMPPQYHQSHGYQQYSSQELELEPHKPHQPQPQPLHKPLLHTQSQAQPYQFHGYQQYLQPQPQKQQSQLQPLAHTQSQSQPYQQGNNIRHHNNFHEYNSQHNQSHKHKLHDRQQSRKEGLLQPWG
ncbi:hypothetical protein EUTSA_v10027514mg [Eutrema salsugineum]|uniref:C2 domain-containing protein n=1 Tax=Eutrema salsugineum TaxID=72664 RepID=V4P8G4_EUTSA|nr:hypothetical protein EUTSA_v10027514mg [Eutrema salsugineum]